MNCFTNKKEDVLVLFFISTAITTIQGLPYSNAICLPSMNTALVCLIFMEGGNSLMSKDTAKDAAKDTANVTANDSVAADTVKKEEQPKE